MMKCTKLLASGLSLLFVASTALAENSINDKLPDPDGKPADMSQPVQVFILMGQSNMKARKHVRVYGYRSGYIR